MEAQEITQKGLPENAYRELKEGEKYIPLVPPEESKAEISWRSVGWGVVMAIFFTFAASYLGLKVGQVFEAAIPIAILAVGLSAIYKQKNTILENVIIQSIGAASGVVVAGAIFTTPAIFILQLEGQFSNVISLFLAIALSAFLGGALGVFFLIPLRKYFVSQMHGKLPFPEATATTEILVAGESKGKNAIILIISMVVGGIYDFVATVIRAWSELLKFQWIPFMSLLNEKARMVLKLDAIASLLGLGYIVGLRYSAVIVAGSFLSTFVFVPIFWYLGHHVDSPISPATIPIKELNEVMIFKLYVQKIGIGAIAVAGIIGIIKNMPIMFKSFSLGFREMFVKHKEVEAVRTDRDIKMSTIIVGILIAIIALWIYFAIISNLKVATIGVVIVVVLSFLFTTVAANAIAIVGTNPVSGMTLVTLLISSFILVSIGVSGKGGMIVALLIGSVVCTALSVAGGFITDLKIGYWIGATPRNQERFKFLGIALAAIVVGLAIFLLNKTYSFTSQQLPAPQANLMATIISSMMSKESVPWVLYGVGGVIAILIEMAKVPTLAFALGMYLPLELNLPLLIGGFIAYMVEKKSPNEKLKALRKERGTLIASGFIAGGALMGVLGAVIKWLGYDSSIDLGEKLGEYWLSSFGEIISIILFVCLCLFVYFYATRGEEKK